jgi:hypothetical protein
MNLLPLKTDNMTFAFAEGNLLGEFRSKFSSYDH